MSELKVDLDPKRVIKSLNDIGDETKKLASTIDDSLGKKSVESVNMLEKKTEAATSKIQAYFRNLGSHVKEDLKSAFDFGKIMAGMKFADQVKEGIGQVLDMEKAFAKLNTRLQLSGKEFASFKTQMGKSVAGTGQKLEDILPGVEQAASRGGVKDPKALTAIGTILARSKAITGEDTASIANEAVETLLLQGQKVTAASMKGMIDAMQGARASGSFKTAAEAGNAMNDIAPFAKKLGIGTRGLAGLTSVASNAGETGNNILKQIMEKGTTIGGQQQLNAVLGQNIFKNGKLDASAIGKIDTKRFGDQAIMQEASGITGANGQELSLFVEAFAKGMPQFEKVVRGANETASQFDTASNNLGSSLDKFREGLINSVRDVSSNVSTLANDMINGKTGNFKANMKAVGGSLADNAGNLAMGAGLTLGVGALAGNGLKGLLGKTKGLAEAKALEQAAGVTPVFVVNASEIGGGGVGMEGLSKKGGLLSKGGDLVKSLGSSLLPKATSLLSKATLPTAAIAALWPSDIAKDSPNDFPRRAPGSGGPSHMDEAGQSERMKEAIAEGMVKGTKEAKKGEAVQYTNPSAYPSTGRSM